MKKEARGLNVPNLRDLNMSLSGSWVRRYHKDEWSLWRKVVDAKYNTVPKIQISFVAMMEILLNFGKRFCGRNSQWNLDTNGRLEIEKQLGYGRTVGSVRCL
jgi:hypothetical protein